MAANVVATTYDVNNKVLTNDQRATTLVAVGKEKEDVSTRLAQLRKWADISAREVDRLLGRAEGHTSLLEAGRTSGIEAKTVSVMAELFGVSMDWLFSGIGAAPRPADVKKTIELAQKQQHPRTGTRG